MPLLSPSAMSPWSYLGFFIWTSCLGAGDAIQYALSGHEATLISTIPGQPENILWTHDGNKVIQFDGSEEKVYSTYKNRIILDWSSADIIIKDLKLEDSGQYKLEVDIQGKLHSSLQGLVVIDEVAKPTISCEVNDTSSSEPRAMLMCSVGTENLSASPEFVWKLPEELKPGSELPISLGGEHDDAVYCCVVSNAVSAKNATFTAKDCYPDKDLGLPTALAVVGVLLCIIIILLLVGFFCWRRRKVPWLFASSAPEEGITQIKDEDVEKQSQHSEQKENGDSKDHQPLISPNEPPKCQENGEPGDNQDETPPPGNVAQKTKLFNRLSNSGLEERTPVRHGRKKDSAKKRPSLSDSPADTHEASGKNSAVDPEKEPLLPDSATLPSRQPLSRLNRSTPTAEPEAATSHHEEGADSDQVTEESTKTELPETVSSGLDSTNEGDSVGTSEDKVSNLQLPSAPEPPSLQSTPPEPDTTESNQNQMNGPASEHDQESDTEKDLEEMGEESNLPPLSPKQPESPKLTLPANTNDASTSQGQQDTDMPEHSLNNHEDPNMPDPKQESNSKCDSDESGELSQTDIYSAEPAKDEGQNEPQNADEKNESQSVPNVEEPGDGKLSADKKSQASDETGAEVAHDQSETEDTCSEEACESEILNGVEKETKETGADPPHTDVTGETDKSGVDVKDKEDQGAEEDQGLNKNVPFSENQDGQTDHKK